MTWKSNTGKFDFAFLIFCTQQFTKNLTHANITCQKISQRWIVLFMYTYSFVQKRSARNIHCQAGEETKLISTIFRYIDRNELIFLVSVWYISKQLLCWWILVDINWATKWQGKYPPLFTSTEVKYIVNYLF